MAEPTYVYEGRIEPGSGAIRTAYLPAESAPACFGVHGAIAQHYGLLSSLSHPAALHRIHALLRACASRRGAGS